MKTIHDEIISSGPGFIVKRRLCQEGNSFLALYYIEGDVSKLSREYAWFEVTHEKKKARKALGKDNVSKSIQEDRKLGIFSFTFEANELPCGVFESVGSKV